MIRSRPVLALIPARGGSKGIHRKNLVSLGGRPLIEYTLRAALDALHVDQVWLSSDDDEILAAGERLGASALRRPAELASDGAGADGVVAHFIGGLDEALRECHPLLLYLQPTSPLRGARHVEAALDLMERAHVTRLTSVVEMVKSPYKAFGIDAQGRLLSLFDEKLSNARRQDLPACYLPNGAIYAFTVDEFIERGGFPSNGSLPFVMSERDSVDIDAPADVELAQRLMGVRHDE